MPEYINKVVYNGTTLIDLTSDTITPDKILSGFTAHDRSGALVVGTNTYDSDTSEDTVAVAEMLSGKTAHARGTQLTGTMPNNGAVAGVISDVDQEYTVALGYHDGSGKVGIAATEKAKIIAGNIRQGVEILGVTGTMSGEEGINAQTKTVTPTATTQTVTPDSSHNYLTQVTVNAIPYETTSNAAGGITVTIAGSGS